MHISNNSKHYGKSHDIYQNMGYLTTNHVRSNYNVKIEDKSGIKGGRSA